MRVGSSPQAEKAGYNLSNVVTVVPSVCQVLLDSWVWGNTPGLTRPHVRHLQGDKDASQVLIIITWCYNNNKSTKGLLIW